MSPRPPRPSRRARPSLRFASALTLAVGAFAFSSVVTTSARAEGPAPTHAGRPTNGPVRILVAAGNKNGLGAERPLRFAHADAERVRDVLVAQGGLRKDDAFLLREPSPADLDGALERARAEAAKHRPEDVTFVFYFSGHGDRDALHVGGDRVMLTDLQAKLARIPAALRIVVTDACRATREKGFVVEEPFAISLSTTTQATGSVWLHASSDGEAAQESDDLQGAVFTHSWLNGLRGAADANGDSRVTLDESFAFAHAQTMIRSSESSGVLQKPEAVMNLRELAPVVLTETARKLSGLGLPPGKDVHYLVYTRGTKSVFAELWGSSGRATELRVPKGRYVVFRRSGSTGALAEVALADGESRELAYGDFRPASLDVLAQKGWDTPDDPRNEVTLGYVVTSNVNFGVLHGPSLAYARAVLPRVAIVGGVDGFFGARAFDANEQSMAGAMGRVAVEPRLELGRFVTLRGGLGGRAGVLVQTLTRTDAARVASDGYVTSRTEAAFAGGPEAYVGLRGATASSMSKAFFVDVALTGNVLLYRENGKTTATPSAGVGTQIGTRF